MHIRNKESSLKERGRESQKNSWDISIQQAYSLEQQNREDIRTIRLSDVMEHLENIQDKYLPHLLETLEKG